MPLFTEVPRRVILRSSPKRRSKKFVSCWVIIADSSLPGSLPELLLPIRYGSVVRMSPKAAMMGANTKREGRSGGGGLKAGSVAVGSDSAAKRGVKHHHRPAPRLRFVPPKEEPAPN